MRGRKAAPVKASAKKSSNDAYAGRRREIARGEGTITLLGMTAVGLDIEKVIHDISSRSAKAEAKERHQRMKEER